MHIRIQNSLIRIKSTDTLKLITDNKSDTEFVHEAVLAVFY